MSSDYATIGPIPIPIAHPAMAKSPATTKPKPKAKPAPRKKAVKPPAKPRGGQSTFSQATADAICAQLSKGIPLAQICRAENMPAVRTVSDWCAANDEFAASIARAREEGYDAIATDCLDIADETGNDTIYGENGERANTEWISRSKLRIETRLKLLAKWSPKRYGDKVDINHGVQPENPLADLLAQVMGTSLPVTKE